MPQHIACDHYVTMQQYHSVVNVLHNNVQGLTYFTEGCTWTMYYSDDDEVSKSDTIKIKLPMEVQQGPAFTVAY